MSRVPTLTRLMVLGLLSRRPTHGYYIQQYLRLTETSFWAGILPGSIYHALKVLDKEGFVRVQATEATGHRTRAIYAVTAEGHAEFSRILAEVWRKPTMTLPGLLYAALSFIDQAELADAPKGIAEQVDRLERDLAQWNRGEEEKRKAIESLPEEVRQISEALQEAVFANGRAHMEADLSLLRYLQAAFPSIKVAKDGMTGGDRDGN